MNRHWWLAVLVISMLLEVPAAAFPDFSITFNSQVPVTVSNTAANQKYATYYYPLEVLDNQQGLEDFVAFIAQDPAAVSPPPAPAPPTTVDGTAAPYLPEAMIQFNGPTTVFSGSSPTYIDFSRFTTTSVTFLDRYLGNFSGCSAAVNPCWYEDQFLGVLDSVLPVTDVGSAPSNPIMPNTTYWTFRGHVTSAFPGPLPYYDFQRGINVGTTFSGTFSYDSSWANRQETPTPPVPSHLPSFSFETYLAGGCPIACTIVYFDPPSATGYDYSVDSGQLITSVVLPNEPGASSYEILETDLLTGKLTVIGTATPGTAFKFGGNGVSSFSVRGIPLSDGVDPSDPAAFVTGLSFSGTGLVNLTMTSVVPEPPLSLLTLLGVSGALLFSGSMRKRSR